MNVDIKQGDCLEVMREWPDDHVDLTFGSPPYEAARTYGIDFRLKGQDWVDWMVERIVEMVRVTKGLVAMVVEGQTRKFRWSASPVLLMADLHRAGVHLRKPPAFHRVGIPGSGGPDWLRNDYEFIVCCTSGGKLPWSDNTAMGHPPKWAPGGEMSHRLTNGERTNQWGGRHAVDGREKDESDVSKNNKGNRPSHVFGNKPSKACGREGYKKTYFIGNGTRKRARDARLDDEYQDNEYVPPVLANPGNVIRCNVGGGQMGSKLAHENEAPFPESLAEFFVLSFCPEGGSVFDPFSGSGTTGSVAVKAGRKFIGTDIRESQVELTRRRLAESQSVLPIFR